MTYTYLRHLNDIFQFGKFGGCTLGEVMMYNPDYLEWVIDNVSGLDCKIEDSAIDEIRLMFHSFSITHKIQEGLNYMDGERYLAAHEDYDDEYETMSQCGDTRSYNRYSGYYVQDEMGYSDDDIDTIFDGDPSAYWNID